MAGSGLSLLNAIASLTRKPSDQEEELSEPSDNPQEESQEPQFKTSVRPPVPGNPLLEQQKAAIAGATGMTPDLTPINKRIGNPFK